MLDKNKMLENAKIKLKAQAEELKNSYGYQIDIDTLTGIKAKVTSQKFYEVKPSDFMPVVVGDQPFAEQILTYKDYSIGNDFESGLLEAGSNNSRLEKVDSLIEGVVVPVKYWAKELNYNVIDLNQAARSGNWSKIESLERSRVKNFQLGIQKVAFLGLESNTNIKGLLTQADVTSNTSTITESLSGMTATEFSSLIENILADYFSNTDSTVLPDTFVIPTNDYLGLGVPFSSTYPNVSKLDYLTKVLQQLTANPNFKVMPLAYAQQAKNTEFLGGGSGLNRYVLYRSADEESLRMDIPVDYTGTVQDTINGFEYKSVAYAGFTGCKAYRPKEVLYFDWS
jgi:hypothetical protein